jgi:hypothetical protein
MAMTTCKDLFYGNDVVSQSLGNISPFLNKGLLESQQLLPPKSPDLNITLVGRIEQACENSSQFAATRASHCSGMENYETEVFTLL